MLKIIDPLDAQLCENGIAREGQECLVVGWDILTREGNKSRVAVLAEPFPCLVSQWVTHAFINNYSQL